MPVRKIKSRNADASNSRAKSYGNISSINTVVVSFQFCCYDLILSGAYQCLHSCSHVQICKNLGLPISPASLISSLIDCTIQSNFVLFISHQIRKLLQDNG